MNLNLLRRSNVKRPNSYKPQRGEIFLESPFKQKKSMLPAGDPINAKHPERA